MRARQLSSRASWLSASRRRSSGKRKRAAAANSSPAMPLVRNEASQGMLPDGDSLGGSGACVSPISTAMVASTSTEFSSPRPQPSLELSEPFESPESPLSSLPDDSPSDSVSLGPSEPVSEP